MDRRSSFLYHIACMRARTFQCLFHVEKNQLDFVFFFLVLRCAQAQLVPNGILAGFRISASAGFRHVELAARAELLAAEASRGEAPGGGGLSSPTIHNI
jgi:hypothetical protein